MFFGRECEQQQQQQQQETNPGTVRLTISSIDSTAALQTTAVPYRYSSRRPGVDYAQIELLSTATIRHVLIELIVYSSRLMLLPIVSLPVRGPREDKARAEARLVQQQQKGNMHQQQQHDRDCLSRVTEAPIV